MHAGLTSETRTDNKDTFYNFEHGSVLLISQTSLIEINKSDTFDYKSILPWRLEDAAAVTSVKKDNIRHL